MAHHVTLIRGDGTGPELAAVTREVLEATGVAITWHEAEAGADALASHGTALPEETLASIRATRTCLKAPVSTPEGAGTRSVHVALRRAFDLYACVRHCKSYPGTRSRHAGVDLVIFRETSEDLYAGVEFERGTPAARRLASVIEELTRRRPRDDAGLAVQAISAFASERIIRAAFEYARLHGRGKVTVGHKANLLRSADGLFLATARRVAERYAGIAFEERLVDSLCLQLVQSPRDFDVLVLPNLYGDLVSDVCAGLVGGLGVVPGANLGDGDIAVFEALHGSAPRYEGRNKVDPTALILSGKLMLEHLGEIEAARHLERAVARVIAEGTRVTYDLKAYPSDPSAAGTREMGQAIVAALGTLAEA